MFYSTPEASMSHTIVLMACGVSPHNALRCSWLPIFMNMSGIPRERNRISLVGNPAMICATSPH